MLIDDTGSESYTLQVRDLESKRDLPDVIKMVSGFAWADSNVIYYVRHDDELRARFVYRHRLGTDPANDPLVYEENDLQFSVSVGRTSSGRFVVISDRKLGHQRRADRRNREAGERAQAGRRRARRA